LVGWAFEAFELRNERTEVGRVQSQKDDYSRI
jgi:hypothetical protein